MPPAALLNKVPIYTLHAHDHDHDHDHKKHDRAIQYFKLQNKGAAVTHFLIKDASNGREIFNGGPTLAGGSDATVDLASTPGVEDDCEYHFGASVLAGRDETDKHTNKVDLKSNLVGVWTWSGSSIAGSKVTFEGYEEHRDEGELQLEQLDRRVQASMRRMKEGTLDEAEKVMLSSWCKTACEGLMMVMVESDLKKPRRSESVKA